jgi:hypothetical protein
MPPEGCGEIRGMGMVATLAALVLGLLIDSQPILSTT